MILQSDQFSCGAASLVNALRAIGQSLNIKAAARLAGTHPVNGTTDAGLLRALRNLGFHPQQLSVLDDFHQAIAALRGRLMMGDPVLLSVDNDEHWVVAIGIIGQRVIVVDSASGDLTLVVDASTLKSRWMIHHKSHDFYTGIVIC